MFIKNYCTDFMFQEVMVCVTCSPSILSHYFQFSFSFQDITKVCWILCLHVFIKKFNHKFQQNELYLENKRELGIMRGNIVDYNVMHTMTCRIMNSMQ